MLLTDGGTGRPCGGPGRPCGGPEGGGLVHAPGGHRAEDLGGPVEDLWRTWLGSRDVGGARWGFPVPDRSKTAVSDTCRPALRRRKSRRALSQTVLTDIGGWSTGWLFPLLCFLESQLPVHALEVVLVVLGISNLLAVLAASNAALTPWKVRVNVPAVTRLGRHRCAGNRGTALRRGCSEGARDNQAEQPNPTLHLFPFPGPLASAVETTLPRKGGKCNRDRCFGRHLGADGQAVAFCPEQAAGAYSSNRSGPVRGLPTRRSRPSVPHARSIGRRIVVSSWSVEVRKGQEIPPRGG